MKRNIVAECLKAGFSTRPLVNTLRVLWVLVIVWYEYGTFVSSVGDCNWPEESIVSHLPDGTTLGAASRPHHVLLVADPQIVDQYSYPSRGSLGSYLTRLIVDLNLRKNWQAALRKKPDAVVFLGDMMDNGRYNMPDDEYEQLFQRFLSIFDQQGQTFPKYFIPGNHDVGLGEASALNYNFSPKANERYVAHFGAPNFEVSIANHSLVFFDALRYAEEEATRLTQRPKKDGSIEFMSRFATERHTDPVILFSHIPLSRPDGASCGPLRERGTLRAGGGPGHGYQNTLERQSSVRLLETFKPVKVFSGDDHDYCEYIHQVKRPSGPPKTTPETTVKTISMVMNVRRPGFQLLSLFPSDFRPADGPSYLDVPCLLPDQLRIYIGIYLPLLVLSLLLVLLSALRRRERYGHNKSPSGADQVAFSANGDAGSTESEDTEMGLLPESRLASVPYPVSQNHKHRRTAFHRRGWRSKFLRDTRDVAVFPVGVFIVITWWVVT